MESMRSLNRSLPGSREPAEDINGAFKAAAISVTNLYKKAISTQAQSRQAGYQDALDDLLSFLDRENLGLQDGEGWLVRQWATTLLDDRPTTTSIGTSNKEEQQAASDSEDEKEAEKEKSPSPILGNSSPVHQSTERQSEPEKTTIPLNKPVSLALLPMSEAAFTFQHPHVYPSKDIDMQSTDSSSPSTTTTAAATTQTSNTTPITNSKREISPRATRQRKLPHNKQRSFSAKILGTGSGSKRRMPFGEYFDLADLTDGNKEDGSSRKPNIRRKLA